MTYTLKIDWIAGNCPVQAEGTINGVEFYFRARGDRWTFIIMDESDNFSYGEEYKDAGWMTDEVAHRLIEDAARFYVNRKT